MKRIFPYILMLVLCFVLTCTSAYAMDGSGTLSSPYLITTATELQNINQDLDAHYRLEANISLYKVDFQPIGNNVDGAFFGSLDGNGHTISYLTVDDDYKYAGLFGYLEGDVSDITLTNVDIEGIRYVGGIAGYVGTQGTISDCIVSGDILGSYTIIDIYIGGIAGYAAGDITDCENQAYIAYDNIGISTSEYIGGIVGYVTGGTVRGCIGNGSFEYTHYVKIGGVVGHAVDAEISDCVNEAAIAVTHLSMYIGGVVYSVYNTVVSDCINSAGLSNSYSSSYSTTSLAGIVYQVYDGSVVQNCNNIGDLDAGIIAGIALYVKDGSLIDCCANYGDLTAECYVSGITHSLADSTITNCYNSGKISATSTGLTHYAAGISLVTEDSTISYCYNSGYVYVNSFSSRYAYGISDSDNVYNCYNGGLVTGGSYDSSFVSSNSKNINYGIASTYGTTNYTLINMESYTSSTAQMVTLEDFTNPDSFPTLDFENTWEIDPDKYGGMPMLRGLPNVVMLNRIVLTMEAGDTFNLYGELDGVTKTGTWSSYSSSVASVNQSGKVTASTAGSTIITLELADGTKANCTVLVYNGLDSFAFDSNVITLGMGSSSTPTYTQNPSNATEKISYESSNPAVASVGTRSGTVTAVGLGTATITATGLETGATAQYTVNVETAYLTSINLTATSDTYNVGTTYTPAYTTSSSTYQDTLVWASSDTSVLTVENGVCTPVSPGTAILSVTTDNGYSDSMTITVLQPSTFLELLHTSLFMTVGETEQIVANMLPENTTDSLSYSSSSTSIVTVSSGLLTAKKTGTATITVTSTSGLKAYCVVTVGTTTVPVTSVSLDMENVVMTAQSQTQLTATVLPITATNSDLVWTSSDNDIATVSQFGVVTAQSVGTATITATASNGLYAQSVIQVVSASGPSVWVTATPADIGETSTVIVQYLRNPGFSGYNFAINFDQDLLEVQSIESQLALGSFNSNIEDADRQSLNVVWYHSSNVEDDCTLFTMELLVNEGATLGDVLDITITNNEGGVYNADSELVPVYFSDGALSVDAVVVGDIYEDGAVNANDASLLARYLTTITDLNIRQLTAADVYADDTVDMKDIVRLAQVIVGMPLANTYSIASISKEPCIAITPIKTADGVAFTVSIADNPGIAGFKLAFDYDVAQMEITEVVSEGMLFGNLLSNLEDITESPLVITWYDSENITSDGVLFTIYATTLGDISWEELELSVIDTDSQLCDAAMDDVTYTVARVTEVAGSAIIENDMLLLKIDFGNQSNINEDTVTTIMACYDDEGKMLYQQYLVLESEETQVDLSHVPAYVDMKIFVLNDQYLPVILIVPSIDS